MSKKLNSLVLDLLGRINESNEIINWSSPVISFGDLLNSKVATLGLNPSNREFVDSNGMELEGGDRRFHTLKSLGISKWSDVSESHLMLIRESCQKYFDINPYDKWFKSLDFLLSGTNASFYSDVNNACHLDLIPFATEKKWSQLKNEQKSELLELSGDILGRLLKESNIQILILNGVTVVDVLQSISDAKFEKNEINSWNLPRKSGIDVKGVSYRGIMSNVSGVELTKEINVFGFNHNIQSSFGVTNEVKLSIQSWIKKVYKELI